MGAPSEDFVTAAAAKIVNTPLTTEQLKLRNARIKKNAIDREIRDKIAKFTNNALMLRRIERKYRAAKAAHARWVMSRDNLSEIVGEEPDWQPEDIAELMVARSARTGTNRREIRAHHLARMFLRGRSYGEVEKKYYTMPDWSRIRDVIQRNNGSFSDQEYAQFKADGESRMLRLGKPPRIRKSSNANKTSNSG